MNQNRSPSGGRPIRRVLFWIAVTTGALVVLLIAAVVGFGYAFSGPRYHGPVSDHFDGEKFHNVPNIPAKGLGAFLKWRLTRKAGAWTDREVSPGPAPPRLVAPGDVRVTFVNHATVLIQLDEVNILTDPIWSERTSPVSFAGPRRHHAPGLRFEDLPPITAVLISHNHYDHLDLPTLKRLQTAHAPWFFVGLGNADLLRGAGIDRVVELDWWQGQPLTPEVRVTAVPAQHFSNRGLFDRNTTLWLGFVVQAPRGHVVVAGDTGFGPHFAQIRQRFGPARLAILPVGAYEPTWFMGPIHQSPAEALHAKAALGAYTAVAMHFGTFALADDAQDAPVQKLEAALANIEPASRRFWVLAPGEGRVVPVEE